MNKRAQFYLIAALVIIGISISLAALYNRAKAPKEETLIYELSKENIYETTKLLDNALLQRKEAEQINGDKREIENLTDSYARLNSRINFLVVYGNETDVFFLVYNNTEVGRARISFGGNSINFPIERTRKLRHRTPRLAENITFNIEENINHTFSLRSGKIFFPILKKDSEGERFVALPETTRTERD